MIADADIRTMSCHRHFLGHKTKTNKKLLVVTGDYMHRHIYQVIYINVIRIVGQQLP